MRILTTCASRNKTDLISVSLNPAADDDEFITEVGTYFYKVLKENWIEAPHTDVGERRSKMIERHKENYRARIKLDVRYREQRPFLKLGIDRMPKKVDTPFGEKTLHFAQDIQSHLFDAVCAVIYRNQKALAESVFEFDGERIYDNGEWHPKAHEVLSKLRAAESAAGGDSGNPHERMHGTIQEVGSSAGGSQTGTLPMVDGSEVE